MKKKLLKSLSVVALLGIMSFPAVAYAEEHHRTEIECMQYDSNAISMRADITYYVHTTSNGVKVHRLWNQTQNRYDSPWTICNC